MNVQVGGGIRTREDVEALLAGGASRVVIGTRAMEDWPWFKALVHEAAMNQKIVLALDAKDGVVATHGWTQKSQRLAVDVAREVSTWPLAAILYTDIARDGMLSGPNIPQIVAMARAGSAPIIASGGVGNMGHLQELRKLPIWGVILGRSLHEGKIQLKEAVLLSHISPL
jgi:phosphoribosylformimino-5-aminoimidazole carboxamide ribotide isomerase